MSTINSNARLQQALSGDIINPYEGLQSAMSKVGALYENYAAREERKAALAENKRQWDEQHALAVKADNRLQDEADRAKKSRETIQNYAAGYNNAVAVAHGLLANPDMLNSANTAVIDEFNRRKAAAEAKGIKVNTEQGIAGSGLFKKGEISALNNVYASAPAYQEDEVARINRELIAKGAYDKNAVEALTANLPSRTTAQEAADKKTADILAFEIGQADRILKSAEAGVPITVNGKSLNGSKTGSTKLRDILTKDYTKGLSSELDHTRFFDDDAKDLNNALRDTKKYIGSTYASSPSSVDLGSANAAIEAAVLAASQKNGNFDSDVFNATYKDTYAQLQRANGKQNTIDVDITNLIPEWRVTPNAERAKWKKWEEELNAALGHTKEPAPDNVPKSAPDNVSKSAQKPRNVVLPPIDVEAASENKADVNNTSSLVEELISKSEAAKALTPKQQEEMKRDILSISDLPKEPEYRRIIYKNVIEQYPSYLENKQKENALLAKDMVDSITSTEAFSPDEIKQIERDLSSSSSTEDIMKKYTSYTNTPNFFNAQEKASRKQDEIAQQKKDEAAQQKAAEAAQKAIQKQAEVDAIKNSPLMKEMLNGIRSTEAFTPEQENEIERAISSSSSLKEAIETYKGYMGSVKYYEASKRRKAYIDADKAYAARQKAELNKAQEAFLNTLLQNSSKSYETSQKAKPSKKQEAYKPSQNAKLSKEQEDYVKAYMEYITTYGARQEAERKAREEKKKAERKANADRWKGTLHTNSKEL